MKILGDPIFSQNPNGTLKSRIGTIFFRTPGLVTQKGIHAMQRLAWIRELNRERTAAGKPELPESEVAAELADSADLIFTPDCVLIRPDPNRMDLAFKADEELQKLVSKRQIRFLNTHAAKVRDALRARGENWRMARPPVSSDEMNQQILSARCAIACEAIYYYNGQTGTRYLTPAAYETIAALPDPRFREQIAEIIRGMKSHNRLGQCEVDLFPPTLPPPVKEAFRALDLDKLSDFELRHAVEHLAVQHRSAVPANLRVEELTNLDWRNEMCAVLSRGPNETAAAEQDLVQGISPEFYRQIEWLPGGRVDRGELIFDPVYEEAQRTQTPELLELCDHRVRSILFNLLRLFGEVEYVNIGRINRSLARHPAPGARRGGVYLIQYKEANSAEERVYMIRFQKWGIAEHLDEGKDLLQSILEANEYSDYILDRRLACQQLGMNLPYRLGFGQFTETYHGANQYKGTTVRAYYFMRGYIVGTASDKVPPARFANPAFAQKFAELMGRAAARDVVVGRAVTETGECAFDSLYEVLRFDAAGLPNDLIVTDHAGSFVRYREKLEELVSGYARCVTRREKFVTDYAGFRRAYVTAFERELKNIKGAYAAHTRSFDEIFVHRPFDVGGSMAYRWHCVLARLAACDPAQVAAALDRAIG